MSTPIHTTGEERAMLAAATGSAASKPASTAETTYGDEDIDEEFEASMLEKTKAAESKLSKPSSKPSSSSSFDEGIDEEFEAAMVRMTKEAEDKAAPHPPPPPPPSASAADKPTPSSFDEGIDEDFEAGMIKRADDIEAKLSKPAASGSSEDPYGGSGIDDDDSFEKMDDEDMFDIHDHEASGPTTPFIEEESDGMEIDSYPPSGVPETPTPAPRFPAPPVGTELITGAPDSWPVASTTTMVPVPTATMIPAPTTPAPTAVMVPTADPSTGAPAADAGEDDAADGPPTEEDWVGDLWAEREMAQKPKLDYHHGGAALQFDQEYVDEPVGSWEVSALYQAFAFALFRDVNRWEEVRKRVLRLFSAVFDDHVSFNPARASRDGLYAALNEKKLYGEVTAGQSGTFLLCQLLADA